MKLLVIYVDAWPYKYASKLLNNIKNIVTNIRILPLIPVYGYTDCFKVSLLTGMSPDYHGYWVSYMFRNKPEPIPIPKQLGSILDVDVLPIRGFRFMLNRFFNIHMFHVRTWPYIYENIISPEASFEKIDVRLRSRGFRTLFSEFEFRGLKYSVFEDRFYGHRLDLLLKAVFRNITNNDIVFIYIDEPDFWGHRYGINEPRYVALLEWLSIVLKLLVKAAIKRGFEFLLFSDHGMVTVKEHLDLYHYVLRDPKYGRSYVVGLDATFFRIFYLEPYKDDTPILTKIKNFLSSKARLLKDEDFMRYHLPRDVRYGADIYALHEGIVLYPNFFSWLKPRGMHAYSPDYNSQHGIVLASEDILTDEGVNIDAPKLFRIITGRV